MFIIIRLSWHVYHDTFIMIRLSWYVCHDMFIIISLSWYLCHNTFVMICLSWYVCHDMFVIRCIGGQMIYKQVVYFVIFLFEMRKYPSQRILCSDKPVSGCCSDGLIKASRWAMPEGWRHQINACICFCYTVVYCTVVYCTVVYISFLLHRCRLPHCVHTLHRCVHIIHSCIHFLHRCVHIIHSCIHFLHSCVHFVYSYVHADFPFWLSFYSTVLYCTNIYIDITPPDPFW